MKEDKGKFQKIGNLFDEDLKILQAERQMSIDKGFGKPISIERLTNVIFRDEEALAYYKQLRERLKKIPRWDKK